MSDTKNPADVNSELPDRDALAAFANSALGARRRRRPAAPASDEPAAAPTPPADTTPGQTEQADKESEPATEETAAVQAEQPSTAPAAEEPKPAVPGPAAAPEESAPAVRPKPKPEPVPATPETQSTEVEVRAVTVPMTRTPVPPGLQGVSIEVQVPALGSAGMRATQCTIMASGSVRDRFAHYQLSKKMAGEKEPSNALVVRRAFLYCKRANLFGKLLTDVYQQHNAVEDEDYDEDGLLGEVIGRRAVRGRLKDSGQQSFRPSEQELVTYDAYSQAYGFPSRSDFLNAVLDEFLPQLPASSRRK